MSTTLEHTELGQLQGIELDGTVQYRGLKYASLKDRFAPPELVTSYGARPTDATKYGPPPVSPPTAIEREFGFIQKSLPLPEVPTHSDLEGLNLNITVPSGLKPGSKLPVYVWIHGGGFAVGSSWYPHYNASPLVKLSAKKDQPIIGVSVNYRLGVTGFMTSKELRDAGYKANNGFHDQRAALKWVQKFIGGFGGDPNEITVVGESAGGLAVTMLLCSEEPLMKRCLSTGGAVLLFSPIPPEVTEHAYQTVVKAFGLADKSPEDRIKALLSLPADELWQKVPMGTPLLPAVDGETVPGIPSFETVTSQSIHPDFPMPGKKWCAAVMIGDSQLDANILAYMGMDARNPGIAPKFIESVNKTLSSHPEAAKTLFASYNISGSTPDDEAVLSILRFATEISFYAASRAFAQGWPCTKENKFFLYHLNEGIPWEGRFQGEAGHIIDVALLFQNYNEHLNEAQRQVALAMGEDFINFVNGVDPWPPVEGGKLGARVYGPSKDWVISKYVEDGNPEQCGRNSRILKLGEMAGYDAIMAAFQNFFQGK